jgi:hypothetical protein
VDETKSEPPKIKVVDRRKFTANGDPLEEGTPSRVTSAPGPPEKEETTEEPAATPGPAKSPPPDEIPRRSPTLFLELVTMLASQAELLLVGAEDLPAQPAEAQRMIDYLGVLEEKTAGNLSDDEAKLLSTALYQLRTYFLKRK